MVCLLDLANKKAEAKRLTVRAPFAGGATRCERQMSRYDNGPATAARSMIAAALVAIAMCLPRAEAAETLRIGGTGSALGGMQRLADAYVARQNDGIDAVVLPSLGSGGGIKALIADTIDLCVSARPLKPDEKAQGLTEREYARTPLVFVTRHDTAAEGVTLEQMTSVYRGDTTTWPDGSRLRLVMRPAAETDTVLLRTMSTEMDAAIQMAIGRSNLFVAVNDQDNAEALESIDGSVGLIAVGQLRTENRKLKPLTIDGLAGTPESLSDGTYPYAKSLYLMVRPDRSPAAQAFATFLASAEGGKILNDAGYLPIAPPD